MRRRRATECYDQNNNKKPCTHFVSESVIRWSEQEEAISTMSSRLDPRLSYPSPEPTPPRISPRSSKTPVTSSPECHSTQGSGITYSLPPVSCPQIALCKSEVCDGCGLFAKRDFIQGELIFTEVPWLSVRVRGDVDSVPTHAEISAAIEAAIDSDVTNEARYHFLHPPNAGTEPSLRKRRDRKFETNCWQTTEPNPEQHGAPIADATGKPIETHHRRIGHLLSAPNHACTPDIQPTWRPAEQRWVVHALRDIRKGEELFVSYDQAKDWNLRADRQLALDFSHSFRCACSACCSLDAELRRLQYQGYRRALAASDARKAKAAGDLIVAARLSYDAWCLVWRDLDDGAAKSSAGNGGRGRLRAVPRRVSPRFIEACEDLAQRAIDAYVDLAGKYLELATATDVGKRLFRQGPLVYESAEQAYRVCYGADDPHLGRVMQRHDGHWQTLLRACKGTVPAHYFEGDQHDDRILSQRWRRVEDRSLIVKLKVRFDETSSESTLFPVSFGH